MSSSERATDTELARRLETWLAAQHPADTRIRIDGFETPKAGFSNDTIVFSAQIGTPQSRTQRRFVLRRAGRGEAIYPVQSPAVDSSVDLQRRVMGALGAAGFAPIAAIVGWEPSRGPLGRPFFLMEFVEGRVLPDFPSYTEQGYFASEASPEVRRRSVESGLSALAEIHRFDWRGGGLGWLDRASGDSSRMHAQLALWGSYLESVPGCREHALLRDSLRWLQEHRPDSPAESAPVLSWGDARIQNLIYGDDGTCRSVMDWEGAAILPPEVDLAWWLGVDHFVHEASGVARLPGELDHDEQVAVYEKRLGRPVRDLPYYRVFATFRTVALMISTYDRLEAMGVSDAGSVSDNPYEGLLQEALGAA
jgi:aminoglycoside phosphotransferase (APT) family kinase protein